MANLLNIGTSGLLAYRQQLSTTGENIANVNTEGYHRRTVSQSELAGATGTLLNTNSNGQGVRVDDIRRSFNMFIEDNVRTTSAAVASLETFKPTLDSIETRITPGPGGVLDIMDGYFDALSSLSVAPDDVGLRAVVMSAGRTFASAVADMGHSLDRLGSSVQNEVAQTVRDANTILQELGDLHARMRTKADAASSNPMYDRRDKLLNDLSEIVKINVSYGADGMARIALGSSPNGPVLLEGLKVSTLQSDGRTVTVQSPEVGGITQTRFAEGGKLQGYANALSSLGEARSQLNAWAGQVAENMNSAHSKGLDANNEAGGDLFSLKGWDAVAATINRGSGSAQITPIYDEDAPTGAIKLVYSEAASVWTAYDDTGTALGSGSSRIEISGMRIDVDGAGVDGDVLELRNTAGDAKNMRFLLTHTDQIAAAGSLTVSAGANNVSSAELSVSKASTLIDLNTAELLELPSASLTQLSATSFLTSGVVGRIPASSGEAVLASYGTQAQITFASGVAASTSLSVSVAGTAHQFDLTVDRNGQPIAPPADDAELAARLNQGVYVNADGQSFAEWGLAVATTANAVVISAAQGDFDTGGAFDGTAGVITQTAAPASEMMIFTREGRQISGPVLTEAEAASLFSTQNGFHPTAVYDTSALNQDGVGYRGLSATQSTVSGMYAAAFGSDLTPATWSGVTPTPARAAFDIQPSVDGRALPQVDIPQGASAAQIAQRLAEGSDLQASAQTNLRITAPADGLVSFNLAGENTAHIAVEANIVDGQMDDLALQINKLTAQTGITAEVTTGGGALILRHPSGENIEITDVTHSTGDPVNITRLDDQLRAVGPATVLGGGVASARFTGTVALRSQSGFSVASATETVAATLDPMEGGLITRTQSKGGSVQDLSFAYSGALDRADQSADGQLVTPSGTFYTVQLGGALGPKASVSADAVTGDTPTDMAIAMREALRAEAPTSMIKGAALAQLPQDGTQMRLALGDEGFTLRMVNGAPVIEGVEADRLSVTITAANEFEISTANGSLDGAMLRVPAGTPNAALFGLAAVQTPQGNLSGRPIDFAQMPAGTNSFDVEIDGTSYAVSVTNNGASASISVPAGFPGTASYDGATGALSFELDPHATSIRIPPSDIAAGAGFATAGGALSVTAEGTLRLTAKGDDIPYVSASGQSPVGTRLTLSDLPNEDLIVVMTEPAALRLGTSFTPAEQTEADREFAIRVVDAAAKEIELFDPETGHSIATRFLDEGNTTSVAGLAVSMSGYMADGDIFYVSPRSTGTGDARNIEALSNLRSRDPETGAGGFTELFNAIVSDIGGQVAAVKSRTDTALTEQDSALRAQADATGVDLDKEAAELMEQQQAYQANAQVVSIAKQLFETLLNAV